MIAKRLWFKCLHRKLDGKPYVIIKLYYNDVCVAKTCITAFKIRDSAPADDEHIKEMYAFYEQRLTNMIIADPKDLDKPVEWYHENISDLVNGDKLLLVEGGDHVLEDKSGQLNNIHLISETYYLIRGNKVYHLRFDIL